MLLKGPAVEAVRFWVPRFELAGSAAEPKQNAMFLGAPGLLRKSRQEKSPLQLRSENGAAADQPFEKEAPMESVVRFATTGAIIEIRIHRHG